MLPFDILVRQHREAEDRLALLDEVAFEGPGAGEELGALAAELLEGLRLHAALEERHLYPLLERVEGVPPAREEAEDHLTLRELMEELEALPPGSDAWRARLLALEDVVVAHAQWEEARLLPRLAASLDGREQEALRRALWASREALTARARPHLTGDMPSGEAPHWGP